MGNCNQHLLRRGAVYYYRRRLPTSVSRKGQVVLSLRTADAFQARRLARKLSVAFDQAEASLRDKRAPSEADFKRMLIDIFKNTLARGEEARAKRQGGIDYLAIDLDDDSEAARMAAEYTPEQEPEEWQGHLRRNDYEPARPLVEKMMAERDIAPPPIDATEYKIFLRKVVATVASALSYDAERERGLYRPAEHPFGYEFGSGVSMAQEDAKRPSLSEAYAHYIEAVKVDRGWSPATIRQARSAVRLFVDLVGDPPFHQVEKSEAHTFRTRLRGLPALHGKSVYIKDTPVQARKRFDALKAKAEAATKEGKEHGIPDIQLVSMGLKTVNKHMAFLIDFYAWCIEKGDIAPGHNPFAGLLHKKKMVAKHSGKRILWSPEQLQDLFSSPVWTGCHSPRYHSKPGDIIIEDAKFWVPLLGLYTGMRENEICSLGVKDVVWDEEARCWIAIVRKGKTVNAPRSIPLHAVIIEIGFIEYCKAAEAKKHKQIFPALKPNNADDSFGKAFTKWFTRYRQNVGIYQRYRDFHSLRHMFDTAIERKVNMNTALVRRVMGHAPTGEAAEAYFEGFRPVDIAPVIAELDFQVDLSHLYLANQPKRKKSFEDPWAEVVKKRTRKMNSEKE